MTVVKIPETLKHKGFEYNLVERTDHKAIYSQHFGNLIIAYEVFTTRVLDNHAKIIRLNKLRNSSVSTEGQPKFIEVFPNDEEFGKRAWTYKSLENAKKCYQGLLPPQ